MAAIVDLSLGKQTFIGFHGEPNSIILNVWEVSSSVYNLFGVRNNKAFTYYMNTTSSSHDEAIDLASSLSVVGSHGLCKMDGYWTHDSAWLVCAKPNEDLYAFHLTSTSKAHTSDHAHYLQNTGSSTTSAISVSYDSRDKVYIFLTSKSNSANIYADTIKIIVLSNARTTPVLTQKKVSMNTRGHVWGYSDSDSIIFGSTRHFGKYFNMFFDPNNWMV